MVGGEGFGVLLLLDECVALLLELQSDGDLFLICLQNTIIFFLTKKFFKWTSLVQKKNATLAAILLDVDHKSQ